MTTLYDPTVWNEGAPPGISAALLNHIEQGIRGAMPVGTVISSFQDAPEPGFLKLDGATISRTTFEDLFDYVTDKVLIGAGKPFGNGDGSTTFVLPNLTQRFPRMPASGAGGAQGGSDASPDHTHTGPSHSHSTPNHAHTNPSTNSDGAHVHSNPNTAVASGVAEFGAGSGFLAAASDHVHAQGNSGSGGSHAHSQGNTGTGGGGTSGSSGTGSTGASGSGDNRPAFFEINFFIAT